MKFQAIEPPRSFRPSGPEGPKISHVASVELAPDEQITIFTPEGAEVDIVRKNWGFYPLPSLNGRLERFKLYPALTVNQQGKTYLLLVEDGKRRQFEDYVAAEGMTVLAWLNNSKPA